MSAPASNSGTSSNSKRHAKYYIQDDVVTFLIEDELFEAPRYLFEWESESFFLEYIQPYQPSTPIRLLGVKACEFASLLDYFAIRQSNRQVVMPQEHWLNLLSISTRFEFLDIKDIAINELDSMLPPLSPIAKLDLANSYQIQQWFLPAYRTLTHEQNTEMSSLMLMLPESESDSGLSSSSPAEEQLRPVDLTELIRAATIYQQQQQHRQLRDHHYHRNHHQRLPLRKSPRLFTSLDHPPLHICSTSCD